MKTKDKRRFDAEALRDLAGEKVFARGEAYYRSGHVEILAMESARVVAHVAGTEDYRTALRLSVVASCASVKRRMPLPRIMGNIMKRYSSTRSCCFGYGFDNVSLNDDRIIPLGFLHGGRGHEF